MQGGYTCTDTRGDSIRNVDPEKCVPTALANVVHFCYAIATTLICVVVGLHLDKKLIHLRSLREQRNQTITQASFLKLTLLSLGIIPAWAWTSAIMGMSTALGVPGILGALLFALLVTVATISATVVLSKTTARAR